MCEVLRDGHEQGRRGLLDQQIPAQQVLQRQDSGTGECAVLRFAGRVRCTASDGDGWPAGRLQCGQSAGAVQHADYRDRMPSDLRDMCDCCTSYRATIDCAHSAAVGRSVGRSIDGSVGFAVGPDPRAITNTHPADRTNVPTDGAPNTTTYKSTNGMRG